MRNSRKRPWRGFTLIEVMIALSVLLIGLVGLANLQLIGIGGNQGARAQDQATYLARELAGGLERLAYTDARLTPTGTAGATAPAGFGSQLSDASHATAWDDTKPIVGVTQDASLEKNSDGTPVYQRRWTVWSLQDGSGDAAKLIAVSVVYHERALPNPREALFYAQKANPQAVVASSQAFR